MRTRDLQVKAARVLPFVRQDVIVRIGARPTVQLFKWGRLRVLLQPWGGWVGTWVWDADEMELDKAHYIWMVLAGPVASLLMAFLFAALRNAFRDGPTIAYAVAETARVGAIVSVALTAIPIKYPAWLYGQPGVTSDGYRIWLCLALKDSRSVRIGRAHTIRSQTDSKGEEGEAQ